MPAATLPHRPGRRHLFSIVLTTPFLATFLSAQGGHAGATPVGGTILAPTTWTLAQSPYIVTRAVVIGMNATLTIQPGVRVCFDPGLGIDVGSPVFGPGTLVARGTPGQPIVFTSSQTTPTRGDWNAIRFTPHAAGGTQTSGSALVSCVVEYGGSGNAPAVESMQTVPWVADSEFRQNLSGGLKIVAAAATQSTTVQRCRFRDNGETALEVQGGINQSITDNLVERTAPRFTGISRFAFLITGATGSVTVSRNRILNNANCCSGAAALVMGGTLIVRENVVSGNARRGLEVQGGQSATVQHNEITGNGLTGMEVLGGTQVLVADNKVVRNQGGGMVVQLGQSQSAVVERNTIVHNSTTGIGGGLVASSVAGSRLVTIRQNLVANNSADRGGGILTSVAIPDLIGNTILNNTARLGGGCLIAAPGGCRVIDNRFSFNFASHQGGALQLSSSGATADVFGNEFYDNDADANSGQGGAIFAQGTGIDISDRNGTRARNCFGDNDAFEGGAIYFAEPSPATLQASGTEWKSWPNGAPQPANLIFDFFRLASLGVVVAQPQFAGASSPFFDLGAATPAPASPNPTLQATGSINPGATLNFSLSGLAPNAPVAMFFDPRPAHLFFGCALIVPSPAVFNLPRTDGTGATTLSIPVSTRLPTGIRFLFQAVAVDTTSANGLFVLTNAIAACN